MLEIYDCERMFYMAYPIVVNYWYIWPLEGEGCSGSCIYSHFIYADYIPYVVSSMFWLCKLSQAIYTSVYVYYAVLCDYVLSYNLRFLSTKLYCIRVHWCTILWSLLSSFIRLPHGYKEDVVNYSTSYFDLCTCHTSDISRYRCHTRNADIGPTI
jgi:hypothetical protein